MHKKDYADFAKELRALGLLPMFGQLYFDDDEDTVGFDTYW